jgi:hypothetical protein
MANYLHLSRRLSQHREFQAILSSLRRGRLSDDKRRMLNALAPRVERFLGGDSVALEAWADFMGAVREGYVFPLTPTPRQVLAATLLAGAAIKKPQIQLRPDLRPELYQARADLLQVAVNVAPPQRGGATRLFRARPAAASAELARYKTFVGDYETLTRRMSAGGKLDSAIQTLLTDPSKSLAPLGSMRTLDSAAIESARQDTILGKATAGVNPTFVQAQKAGIAYAPNRLALTLNRFRCVRQQEDAGSDEIFWGGSFVRCTNLAQVYAQIEQMMKQGNSSAYNLDFHWGFSSFVRPASGDLFTVNSGGPWLGFGASPVVFEQEFFNGFGPWAGVVFCIEDDDKEYDAVVEVIDTVGDYADQVGHAASTVSVAAAAGGVTGPLAVASGAVSLAANVVSLGADLAGAVVDIVNFFDKDDMIDSVNLTGMGDYAVWNKNETKSGTETQTPDLQESPEGAHYQLELGTTYAGLAEFQRTWGCSVVPTWFPLHGGWFDKAGGPFGNSGEIERTVAYSPPVHYVEAFDEEQKESDPGNAHVLEGYPTLEHNGTIGRVKVHWGISAFRSFKFKIFMQAFRFERRL